MAVRVRVYTWPPTCGMGTLSGRTVGYIFDPLCGMVDLFHRPQMAWPLRVPMPYGGVKQMGAECRGGGAQKAWALRVSVPFGVCDFNPWNWRAGWKIMCTI